MITIHMVNKTKHCLLDVVEETMGAKMVKGYVNMRIEKSEVLGYVRNFPFEDDLGNVHEILKLIENHFPAEDHIDFMRLVDTSSYYVSDASYERIGEHICYWLPLLRQSTVFNEMLASIVMLGSGYYRDATGQETFYKNVANFVVNDMPLRRIPILRAGDDSICSETLSEYLSFDHETTPRAIYDYLNRLLQLKVWRANFENDVSSRLSGVMRDVIDDAIKDIAIKKLSHQENNT